jgi:hypothetical protein
MQQQILTNPLNFLLDLTSEVQSMMTGLLKQDMTRRLGAKGDQAISFFCKVYQTEWVRNGGTMVCKDDQ